MPRKQLAYFLGAAVFCALWCWLALTVATYHPADWTSGPHPWNAVLKPIALVALALRVVIGTSFIVWCYRQGGK